MTTQNVYIPQQGDLSDLAGWLAGDLGTAYARLYDTSHVFSPADTPASYHEASFVGYSPVTAMGWGVPFINMAGKAEVDSSALVWAFTGGLGTAPVYGIFVTDPSNTKLLLVAPFLAPIILTPTQPNLSQVLQVTAVSEL